VARPARAARSLEPPVGTQTAGEFDHPGFADPAPRPRRALPGGPLTADTDKGTATEAGLGRRAMDPLPSRYTQPASWDEPVASMASSSFLDSPPPRRSAPPSNKEPVVERAPASTYRTPPGNSSPGRPQPVAPFAPVPPPAPFAPVPPPAPLASPPV